MAFLTQLAPGSAGVMERLLYAHLLGGARNAKVGVASFFVATQWTRRLLAYMRFWWALVSMG